MTDPRYNSSRPFDPENPPRRGEWVLISTSPQAVASAPHPRWRWTTGSIVSSFLALFVVLGGGLGFFFSNRSAEKVSLKEGSDSQILSVSGKPDIYAKDPPRTKGPTNRKKKQSKQVETSGQDEVGKVEPKTLKGKAEGTEKDRDEDAIGEEKQSNTGSKTKSPKTSSPRPGITPLPVRDVKKAPKPNPLNTNASSNNAITSQLEISKKKIEEKGRQLNARRKALESIDSQSPLQQKEYKALLDEIKDNNKLLKQISSLIADSPKSGTTKS